MDKHVDFYFDLVSPASYLAYTQLPAIAADTQAGISWRPVLLGGIFKATGNVSPAEIAGKGRYFFKDLSRFARRYGVDFEFNPHFPLNGLPLMRLITGLQMHEPERFLPCLDALYEAIWVDGRNLDDEAVLDDTLAAVHPDPAAARALAARDDVKARLREETDAAVARGLFGVPTFFVGDEMFFGQDRLDFVAEALVAA